MGEKLPPPSCVFEQGREWGWLEEEPPSVLHFEQGREWAVMVLMCRVWRWKRARRLNFDGGALMWWWLRCWCGPWLCRRADCGGVDTVTSCTWPFRARERVGVVGGCGIEAEVKEGEEFSLPPCGIETEVKEGEEFSLPPRGIETEVNKGEEGFTVQWGECKTR